VSVSSCLSRSTTAGPASAQFPGLVLTDEGVRQEVNDRYGHEAGDRLLRFAAFSMAEAFRASDVVGRFGGDEFVAVLPGHSGDVAWATKRLASAVRTCNDQMAAGNSTAGMAEPFALSMSVGAARFMPDDPEPPETLLERADAAMYDDKQLRCRSAGVAVLGRDPVGRWPPGRSMSWTRPGGSLYVEAEVIAWLRWMLVADPKNGAPPNENTPPSLDMSQ
jgi:diguanylate cyclase (GGDEF)-like protein